MRRVMVATAAAPLLFAPALAQQSQTTPTELQSVTVTAARADRAIADIPQSVQVIRREEIEAQLKQSASASAALAKLAPGFSESNQTISGASETYRGRDLLVLLDGVPLNTPLRDVSRILALIDLNAVERIEIVAGASSLYGAGATGGTVNFITKQAESGPARVSVHTAVRAFTANVGESLAPELSTTVTGKAAGGLDYLVTGTGRMGQRTYDGAGRELPSDAMLGQGGGDRFGSGNFLAKLGYDLENGKRVEASGTWIYFEQNPDYLTNYASAFAKPDYSKPYVGQSVLEDTKSFSLRFKDKEFRLGALNLTGFYNDVKKRFNYSEFSYPANSQVYYSFDPSKPTSKDNQTTLFSNRGGVNATVDTPLNLIWQGVKLTWGGDVVLEKTHQTLTSGAEVFTPLTQTTTAAFALLQAPIGDRLTLRGGARYEDFALDVEDFTRPTAYAATAARTALGYQSFVLPALRVTGGSYGYSATTFSLGATFKLNAKSELFGGYSQGFALPDVGAYTRRAGISTTYACAVTAPNCLPTSRQTISFSSIAPDAQIVDNYELGVRGSIGALKTSLTSFMSTSDKGVTFDAATNTISQQKELIYGAELTGEYLVNEQLSLGGTFAYREGRYDSNKDGKLDSWLPNNRIATPYRATLYGDYRFENDVLVRVEGQAFSGRDKAIDLAGTHYKIKSGATMNLSLSAQLLDGEAYTAVNNLFDANIENPTGSSVRNLTTYSWGRTITLGYRRSF